MAKNQRTYQWVNGRVHEVGAMNTENPSPQRMGIQTALLVFTLSSVTLIFAVPALLFVLFVIYSVVFG
ncbi:hypothetical protein [Pseudomonas veronii]